MVFDKQVELLEGTHLVEEFQCRGHRGDSAFFVVLVKQGKAAYGLQAVSLQVQCKVLQMNRVREDQIVLSIEYPCGFIVDLAIDLKNGERRMWYRDVQSAVVAQIWELASD